MASLALDAIDLSAAYAALDLEQHLRDIPDSALLRGIWFSITAQHMRRAGAATEMAWRTAVPLAKRSVFKLHPVKDYLRELAAAGAVLEPANPKEGIRRIWRSGAEMFAASFVGRSVSRLVRPDPATALRFVERTRDQSCNYGSWSVRVIEAGHAVMHLVDEYIWIDCAHLGGAEGMLLMCGATGSVEANMISRYEGKLVIRWDVRR